MKVDKKALEEIVRQIETGKEPTPEEIDEIVALIYPTTAR